MPGGRVVIATFAHEHFDGYWAARYFPSIGTIDRRAVSYRAAAG